MTKKLSFKFNLIRFLIFVIGFILIWICGHFVFSTCIAHTEFVFSVAVDILKPLIFAIPLAAFTQLLHME